MNVMTTKHLIRSAAVICAALMFKPVAGAAQGLFAKVAQVDESVITEFEVQQRSRFLQVMGSPASSRAEVLDELIKDRLRDGATMQSGVVLSPEDLQTGLSDFAARSNLSAEELVEGLESAGVARETFRDFVATSLVWRDYIRARFGNRVQISDAEIDRAMSSVGANTNIEVLLSEIIIPAPPERAEAVIERAEIIAASTTEAEFSNYARRFSATASRGNGGRLKWLPIAQMPPTLRPILLALAPGQVTAPLPIPDAVALFQLRDIRETSVARKDFAAIEYAAYYIAGGRAPEALGRARAIRAQVDRCDDLYGIAKGQPESMLDRGSLPPSEIPPDIALELAKLDPGEVSTALTRADGETLVFLMLCGRTPVLPEDQEIDREAVSAQLRNQRLSAFSDALLEELRAEATIRISE